MGKIPEKALKVFKQKIYPSKILLKLRGAVFQKWNPKQFYLILLIAHAICLVQKNFLHQKKTLLRSLKKKLTQRHNSSNNRAQKKTVNKHCAAPRYRDP